MEGGRTSRHVSQSAVSTLDLHTFVRFAACRCCARARLIITVRWMEEQGGGDRAVDFERIEQRGASSVAVAVN